jgi:hypothetical protein
MKMSRLLSVGTVMIAGCAGLRTNDDRPTALNASYNDAALRPLPEDNAYDQPGQLPANSGGTDGGRIGADERLGQTH